MLSDAKLGQFEVITPQQYNGYPWCNPFLLEIRTEMFYKAER